MSPTRRSAEAHARTRAASRSRTTQRLTRVLIWLLALVAAFSPTDATLEPVEHAAQSAAEIVPGQVIALLHRAEDLEPFMADVVASGYTVLDTIPALTAVQIGVPVGQELTTIDTLAADPRVSHVEPNGRGHALLIPDDAVYREHQWSLRKIGMENVWEITTGTPEVIVAVLDTGVDAGHPDLVGNVLRGYDFLNDDPDSSDDSSHGTHVAGVIAAIGNNGEGVAGIAWRSRVLPVKVLDSQGSGPDAAVSKGIIYAVENRAKIINLSSGTPRASRLLEEAIRFAEQRGVLVVAAAGNTGDAGNEAIFPAAYPTVLAVAATDEHDEVPSFSQRQPYVGVAAPGTSIASTAWRGAGLGPYVVSSGTSAAAPHVSGLAALLLSVKPTLTPAEIRDLIRSNADPIGPQPRDTSVGAGRINALRTVNRARPAPATVPGAAPTPTPRPAPGVPVARAPQTILPVLRPLPQPAPLPAEPLSWYFAEGNTMPSFDTWLVLQNPLEAIARARITYTTQDGIAAEQSIQIGPSSRQSIHVNDVVPNALVSIQVEADTTVFAERSVYFGHDGIGGIGARSPAREWYLAEGSAQPPFDTWILLQNPNPAATVAHLTFMLESGGTVEVDQPISARSRVSLHANDLLPAIGFSTMVTADLPIVAERSMYFQNGGGHGSVGVKTPDKTWFIAEGDTRTGTDTWILMQNPSPEVANVKVTFMAEDGTATVAYYALDPSARLSLFADTVVPNVTFGARIESDQPIIVERSVYVAGGVSGHSSAAVAIPSTEWYLPEGSTRSPYREVLALLNPNSEPTQVDVTFMRADGQPPVTMSFLVRPTSRYTIEANRLLANAEISTRVVADRPVVVERSLYFDRGATNSPGLTR